jgi:preprotein translocase subunit SecG
MSFLSGILTVLLVANCVLLILLVLVQLPKKDAGAGMAFGGGAADALFGAGSGNVLTKITKWATGVFFVMALILGLVDESAYHRSDSAAFEKAVQQKQSQMPARVPPATQMPSTQTTSSNSSSLPAIPAASVPATPSPTN